jgi:hypothetical protein
MTETTQDRALLLFNWFEQCEKENIILSFKGDFNQDLVNAILLLAEREPDVQGSSTVVRARVFSIMVECMQNIRKYGAVNDAGSEMKPGIILVCRDAQSYSLKTGNLVENEEVNGLKARIENVIKLGKDELKVLHKKILSETQLSEKSGAGLGIISILRKCDGFSYTIRKLNDRVSFYSLDIKIAAPAL